MHRPAPPACTPSGIAAEWRLELTTGHTHAGPCPSLQRALPAQAWAYLWGNHLQLT